MNACLECVSIVSEACRCFANETQPHWLRVTEGMQVFDTLPYRTNQSVKRYRRSELDHLICETGQSESGA